MLKKSRWCCNCKSAHGEFAPAVHLEKSGLSIYFHEDELLEQKRIGEENRRSIILYNNGDKELKRFDFIAELCRNKTKCFKCTAMIQRVRNLLDDITIIRKYQIIGICEYCKRPNMRTKCKRCEHIVNKFVMNKVQECKNHEERFKNWISEIQRFLTSILQGKVICKHNISLDYKTRLQLDNLLQHLKSSLPVKQPQIEVYSDRLCLQSSEKSIVTRKKVLDELLFKLNSDNKIGLNIKETLSNYITESESSCVCKYLKNNKTEISSMQAFQTKDLIQINQNEYEINDSLEEPFTLPLIKETKTKRVIKDLTKKQIKHLIDIQTEKTKQKEKKEVEEKDKTTQNKKEANQNISTTKYDKIDQTENEAKIAMHINNEKAENVISKKQKLTSHKITPSKVKTIIKEKDTKLDFNLCRFSERKPVNKPPEKHLRQQNIPKIPLIADLPILKTKAKSIAQEEDSISTMECASNREHIPEMIKGNKIVGNFKDSKDGNEIKKPLLYKILADCTKSLIPTQRKESAILDNEKISEHPNQADAGAIFYKLSDRKFIENGWTKLPTTKIMRRMNIYKMFPRNEAFDWFRNHKEKILFYDSGGKLAEVFENGSGKWFYENGDIALDHYNSRDITSEKRYIIYSSSEDENIFLQKKKSVMILGCFDAHGNGVVYDYYGNARLKYNQSEGLVIDKTIGPPGRWKWHTLNDPPELVHAVVETEFERDPYLRKFVAETDIVKLPDEEMIAIEHDHIVRERAKKMSQEYKPFEIRMKALKINSNFSLRIVNQSKIYLQFRCGRYYFKQNLGMMLQSDEIIDTVNVDFGDVTTPYDRAIPKSGSIAAIQNILLKAKYSRNNNLP